MEKQEKVSLDIPALSYFSFGNAYTGSCGGALRYRIAKDGETLRAVAWYTDVCCELSGEKTEMTFPESDDGLHACIAWIEGLAEKAKK